MQDRRRPFASHRLRLSRLLALLAAAAWLAAASAQAADTAYATTTTPLLAAASGSQIGSVRPGTPFTVLGSSGGEAHVQLSGWVVKGSETVLFEAVGLHAVLATFPDKSKVDMKVVKSKKDDYGTAWDQVQVTGWLASKATTDDVSTVWKKAENLYQTRCSACHALHQPDEFTPNQWPGVLKEMGKNAALDQQDLDLVTAFLQAHAKSQ